MHNTVQQTGDSKLLRLLAEYDINPDELRFVVPSFLNGRLGLIPYTRNALRVRKIERSWLLLRKGDVVPFHWYNKRDLIYQQHEGEIIFMVEANRHRWMSLEAGTILEIPAGLPHAIYCPNEERSMTMMIASADSPSITWEEDLKLTEIMRRAVHRAPDTV